MRPINHRIRLCQETVNKYSILLSAGPTDFNKYKRHYVFSG